MSKLREAIKEARHTVNVCRIFWEKYWAFRAANPNPEVVFIYVGLPDMAATIVRQSPLYARFEEWEASRKGITPAWDPPPYIPHLGDERIAPGQVMRIVPAGSADKACDCPACTASKATRSFDA